MSDIRTKRHLTRTATGAYLQYADFDPTNWHRVRIELPRESTFFVPEDGVTTHMLDWLTERQIDFRLDYTHEAEERMLPGGGIAVSYRDFLEVFIPPNDGDQAMLFKLTFAGI